MTPLSEILLSLDRRVLSRLPFFRLRHLTQAWHTSYELYLDRTGHFSRELLYGHRRHIREERVKSLHHRRVRENGVAEPRIWQICQHRRLHRGDDLAGLGANHREAENAVVITDKSLHESMCFGTCLLPHHRAYRQLRDAYFDALAFRFGFAQPHARKRRVRKHAVRNQPIARAAVFAREIVLNDPEIVGGYVGELWAPGAFPDGPHLGGARLQPLVNANVAATVQLNTGLLKPDPSGVGNAPRRDQNVAALDVLLTGGRAHDQADFLSGSAVHLEGVSRHQDLNTFITENPLDLICDVGILPVHELRPTLYDRHPATEATVGLGKFETDTTTPEHDQMFR